MISALQAKAKNENGTVKDKASMRILEYGSQSRFALECLSQPLRSSTYVRLNDSKEETNSHREIRFRCGKPRVAMIIYNSSNIAREMFAA